MFPIRNTRGRVIGFGGRVFGNEQPKYLNSPETELFHKGRELYGLYEARMALRRIERLLVVEGYMDVVALAQAGIPNAVATLGTATGVAHFEKLFRAVARGGLLFRWRQRRARSGLEGADRRPADAHRGPPAVVHVPARR